MRKGYFQIVVEGEYNVTLAEPRKTNFQLFFTTKSTGEGTGLGFSLSYDIITKGHGGEIELKTKKGEGSLFILSLPVLNHKTT